MYNRWQPPLEELYHHGVKGMKWGVRKEYKQGSLVGNRRGLQRELNRTDKRMGLDSLYAQRTYNKLHKLEHPEAYKRTRKTGDDAKIQKLRAKYRAQEAEVRRGQATVDKLLKDVAKSGYTHDAAFTKRTVMTGRDLALSLLSGGTVLVYHEIPGIRYKVKQSK